MSLKFKTNDPNKLLNTLRKAIDENKIVTWSYDKDGDFTHTTDQWKNKAWLRPRVGANELIFSIIGPVNTSISSLVYGIYHGRFTESMLVHFDDSFDSAISSALPSDGDMISS